MAILKHIASKSSNYGAALEYLIFKHDEIRKAPILDQNGNRIMRDEFYLDGLNCEPYSFDAACQQLNREYQKNKNKNEIKSHHYIISFDPRDSTENCLTGKRAQELGLEYAKANFPGHQDVYKRQARDVLEELQDKYMNTGIYEIEKTEILRLDPFLKMGKPQKIASYFGGKDGYLKAVKELEQAIYEGEIA